MGEGLAALGAEGVCLVQDPGDPALLVEDTVEIPVQVLGKVRGKISVPVGSADDVVTELALSDPIVAKHVEGKTIRKVIVVQNKMVNIVAN